MAPHELPPAPREAELIAAWGAGVWRGRTLRATNGVAYTVIYQGRPGGPAGPDFRDAVLRREPEGVDGVRVTGDIELHLTPAGWRAHGHDADPRYNQVALHVTLRAGGAAGLKGTPLASGAWAPLAALSAQPPDVRERAWTTSAPASWPCVPVAGELAVRWSQTAALRAAGWVRLRERASALAVARARIARGVAGGATDGLWAAGDRAFFIAIAEALGYGRDRDALRRCGEILASGVPPDSLLAEAGRLPVVERRRLMGLLALLARWRMSGPLAPLRAALAAGMERAGPRGACLALVEALTVAEERGARCRRDARPERGGVSAGRVRIVAINVALPYLLLDARDAPDRREQDERWARTAAAVEAFPGLPSNQITRVMAAQLGLTRAPDGVLAQQGLHHLWERHCREKRCATCPCALRPIPAWLVL